MLFKRIILLTISFQLAISGNLAHAQTRNTGDESSARTARELAQATADMSPADRERQQRLAQIGDEIERGQVSLTNAERDPELEVGQSVKVFGGGAEASSSYDPLDSRIENKTFAYTGLNVRIVGRDVVVEAVRGTDAKGLNGVVVAQQWRPNLDAVAMARDGEFVSFILRDGSIRVLYVGQIISQIFNAPLVFFEVYTPSTPVDLSQEKISAKYITRGVSPEGLVGLDRSIIIPTTPENVPEITAGDLMVTSERAGQEHVLGIYAREIIYKRIEVRAAIKAYMASLLSPNSAKMDHMEGGLNQALAAMELEDRELNKGEMSGVERAVLRSYSVDRIAGLATAAKEMKSFGDRAFDEMTFAQWKESFAKLKASALRAGTTEAEMAALEREWQKHLEQVKQNGQTEAEIESADKATVSEANDSVARQGRARAAARAALGKFMDYVDKHKLTVGSLVGIGAMLASPFGAQWAASTFQLEAINKFYKNYFPSVLQDSLYRVPLALSTISVILFWPLGVVTSLAFGYGIKVAERMVSSSALSNTAFGLRIRDINKNWNSDALSTWQRIHTLGFRIYAFLILSAATRLGQQILRQKSLVSALVNGLNPAETIDPNSELGKRVGAQRKMSLGLNNPLPYPLQSSNKLQEETEMRKEAQALLVSQKNRAESRAWIAAAMAVSHESGIDMATLTMVAKEGLTEEVKDFLLNNGRNKRSWYLVADKVARMMMETGRVGLDERELNPQEIVDDYRIARDVANQIKVLSQGKLNFEMLKISFRRAIAKSTASLFTFGLKQYEFLNAIYASTKVSEIARRSFVIDYIFVVGIPAFVGARANLNEPNELAAVNNPGSLWTNPPHLMDVIIQVYLYFFVAGSRYAMVYQSIQMEPEGIYTPKSATEFDLVKRSQGFWGSTRNIIKSAFDFDKSDVGGFTLRGQLRRLTTMQAGFIIEMTGRLLMVGQSVGAATKGWLYGQATGLWYIGVWWDLVNQGIGTAEDTMAEKVVEVKKAQAKIDQGRDRNDRAAVEEGYKDLIDLYVANEPAKVGGLNNYLRQLAGQPEVLPNMSVQMVSMEAELRKAGHHELVERHREVLKSGTNYWGLVAGLQIAIKNKDQESMDLFSNALRDILLSEKKTVSQEINQLNVEGILEYSVISPPTYTELSHFSKEVAVFAGAVATTVLSLYQMVFTFRDMTWMSPHISRTVDGVTSYGIFTDVSTAIIVSGGVLLPLWWLAASQHGREVWREFRASPNAFWKARWYGKNAEEARAKESRDNPRMFLPAIERLSVGAARTCAGAHL